jgi:hypothetical protein|tara:strand:+ start:5012 stop:5290 length:279 start_codon:yes stop_codon:yes gene_type:complete
MLEKKIEEALKTAKQRGEQYGHSYLVQGEIMKILFPNGIDLKTPEDFNRYGALNLIVTKLIRYCNKWDKPHQDSIHDLGVYAFILETIDDSY